MRNSSLAITGLGLAVMAVSAGATCDPAFNSNSISVATSTHGHIAASRGNDGLIRISENWETDGYWGGWLNLSRTSDQGSYSDAWIQPYVNGSGNYVYAVKGDSLIQWRLGNYSSTFTVVRSALSGATGISGRPASARLSSTIKTAVVANFNGTIMVRSNTNGTWGSWTSLGLSNAQGSPWITQMSSTTAILFVRTSNQMIWNNYWDGTSWTGWGQAVPNGVNSDPAATYDASTGNHYLYFLNTSDVTSQWTYSGGWTSTTLPTFPGKKSFTAVMSDTYGSILYGQDYQGNTFSSNVVGGTPTTSETNCLVPYSTNY